MGKSVENINLKRSDYIKTKFPGIYYVQDSITKVKTYIARIKIVGVIDTEQIVGYSNDSIKTNPSIAYEKRTELINKLKNGESIKVKEDPTLDKFFKGYLESRRVGQTLTATKIKIYDFFYEKHFPDSLKRKKLKQITKDDFQKIIDKMKSEHKPSYIETIKSCFSPMFNEAIRKEILSKNIIPELNFPKYDKNRYFTLSEDKAKALYKKILEIPDNQYRAMFLFLLRGRRANEVLSLEWQHIDLEANRYTIIDSQSKIRKTLSFPLDEELKASLGCLKRKEKGLVFVSSKTGKKFYSFPKRLWNQIKDDLGIEDMKIHDFRHLLGFTLVNKGVPLEYISKALGHSKITTTQMYSNQKEKMAGDAIEEYLKHMK